MAHVLHDEFLFCGEKYFRVAHIEMLAVRPLTTSTGTKADWCVISTPTSQIFDRNVESEKSAEETRDRFESRKGTLHKDILIASSKVSC